MRRVQIYSDNNISIDGKHIGGVRCITPSGDTQNPTGARAQQSMNTRIYTSSSHVDIDLPAYVDGKPNEALADAFLALV